MNNQKGNENHAIKKIPYLSTSSLLFDEFLIFGYSEMEQQKIILRIEANMNNKRDDNGNDIISFPFISNTVQIQIIKNDHHPSLLSSISNPNKQAMLPSEMIKHCLFPNAPPIIFSTNEQYYKENPFPEYNSVFFLNVDTNETLTKTLFYGYAFVFYEKQEEYHFASGTYYFPKAICFISQYPFFSHYYDLAKTIRDLFNNLQAPIEFILYNIINRSIAPLNNSVNIEWVPDMFKGDLRNTKAKFDCLSGYPIVDLDISELFAIFPVNTIISIFLFSFLESPMLFFSENIEILNCILYIISVLQYPCTDTMYLWHLISVSETNFINKSFKDDDYQSKFVEKTGSSLMGVNCTFNSDMDLDKFSTDELIIIDIDNRDVFIQKKPNKETKVCSLYHYFNELLSKPIISSIPFEENIRMLQQEIAKVAEDASSRLNNENNQSNKGVKFTFIKSMTKEIQIKNKIIQEIFYSFVLNTLKPFYPFISIKKDISKLMKKQVDLRDYINETKKLNKDNKYEYDYYEELCEATKITLYCCNFLNKSEALHCYLIPFFFSDEFLQMNRSIIDEYSIPHFEMIDSFYFPKDNKVLDITLCNYSQILVKIPKSSLTMKYKSNHLIQNFTLRVELKSSLIFLYSNIISSLEEDELTSIFPVYDISYESIHYHYLSDHLEEFMINKRQLGIDYIISYATTVLSIITLEVMNKEGISQLFQLVVELLIYKVVEEDKLLNLQFLRKNISMYIHILYYYIHRKNQLKVINQFLLTLYHQLLDVLVLFETQPNVDLLNNLTDIDRYDNSTIDKDQHILNKHFIRQIQKKMNSQAFIDHPNQLILLQNKNNEISHIIRVIENKCRDGVMKDEAIFKAIEASWTNPNLTLKCPKCRRQLMIKLLFKTTQIRLQEDKKKEELKVNIFSPIKIYGICKELLKTWFDKRMSYNALDRKTIKQLVVNLLFYQSRLNLRNTIPIIEELFI